MPANTWILVADGSRGFLLNAAARTQPVVIDRFEHPASRAHGSELVTDRSPRTAAFGAPGHGTTEIASAHEQELIRFARTLVQRLEHGRNQGDFGELVIVAPPHFLGLLGKQLPVPLARCVGATFNKDVTLMGEPQLCRYVQSLLETRPGSVER